jgi:hypothetical protein
VEEGLLYGLSEGLKAGFGAYKDEKDRIAKYKQHEEEMKMKRQARDDDRLGLIFKASEVGLAPEYMPGQEELPLSQREYKSFVPDPDSYGAKKLQSDADLKRDTLVASMDNAQKKALQAARKLNADMKAKGLYFDEEKQDFLPIPRERLTPETQARISYMESGGLLRGAQAGQAKANTGFIEAKTETEKYRPKLILSEIENKKFNQMMKEKGYQLAISKHQDSFLKPTRDVLSKKIDLVYRPMRNNMYELVKIMKDESIPKEIRIQKAKESLKLINTALTGSPDAVGVEEQKRLGSFLDPNWDPTKTTEENFIRLEADLPKFVDSMILGVKMMDSQIDFGEKRLGQLGGQGLIPQGSKNSPQQAPQATQTQGMNEAALKKQAADKHRAGALSWIEQNKNSKDPNIIVMVNKFKQIYGVK